MSDLIYVADQVEGWTGQTLSVCLLRQSKHQLTNWLTPLLNPTRPIFLACHYASLGVYSSLTQEIYSCWWFSWNIAFPVNFKEFFIYNLRKSKLFMFVFQFTRHFFSLHLFRKNFYFILLFLSACQLCWIVLHFYILLNQKINFLNCLSDLIQDVNLF